MPRTFGAFLSPPAPRGTRSRIPAQGRRGCRSVLGSLTVEGRAGEPRLCSLDQPESRQPPAGWWSITAVVDSGAEETVAPPGLLPGRVEESPMQRAGGRYRVASGSRPPNLGQQVASFRTPEGLIRFL